MKITTAALAIAVSIAVIVPATVASAADVTFVKKQDAGQVMAHRLSGTRVFNSKGEVIGNIYDVAFDERGQAQTVVVSVGGFLGVGSKYIGVPYADVKIGPVVESSRIILLNATKADLMAAPSYSASEPTRTMRAKQKASRWIASAKQKAIALGNEAKDKVQEMRDKVTAPAESKK